MGWLFWSSTAVTVAILSCAVSWCDLPAPLQLTVGLQLSCQTHADLDLLRCAPSCVTLCCAVLCCALQAPLQPTGRPQPCCQTLAEPVMLC
jgi:hypothetical protein